LVGLILPDYFEPALMFSDYLAKGGRQKRFPRWRFLELDVIQIPVLSDLIED
jgi:hypothetical protein